MGNVQDYVILAKKELVNPVIKIYRVNEVSDLRIENETTPVTSSQRSTRTFWYVIHSINHVTKRPTPSPDQDSGMELKAYE